MKHLRKTATVLFLALLTAATLLCSLLLLSDKNVVYADSSDGYMYSVTVDGTTTYSPYSSILLETNNGTLSTSSKNYVKLLNNIEEDITFINYTDSDVYVELDLNGYVVNTNCDQSLIANKITIDIVDSRPTVQHKFKIVNGTWRFDEDNGDKIFYGGCLLGGSQSSGGGVNVIGSTLNLYAGNIIGAKVDDYGGGVYVIGGTFNMYGGKISCNRVVGGDDTRGGSAVYLEDNSTFNMSGGEISENTSIAAGSVYVGSGCTFNMSGGTISGNTAGTYGGGVYTEDSGEFTMNSGTITNNSAEASGGGVFVGENGTGNINGGTISNNVAQGNGGGICFNICYLSLGNVEISGNSAADGGGIYCDAINQTLTLTNATIKDNKATSNGGGMWVSYGSTITMSGGTISGNTANRGGGVWIDEGTFTINNGSISGNSASTDGGGVYIDDECDFNVSGSSVISDNTLSQSGQTNNVYLISGKTIGVTGALTNGAKIGVTLATGYTGGFTSGYSTYNTAKPSAYFVADNGECIALSSGEAAITGHTYGAPVWSWSEDGKSASATFTCTECGDQQIETATITSAEKTAATCEANGTTLYTAKVTFNGTQYSSTKEVADIPALGHDYQAVVTAPTCTEQGYTTYTCTHDNSHTYIGDYVSATGHAYGEPVWTWNETSAATAPFTCANDQSHTVTETATVTNKVTTAATCETAGERTYTATVTFNGQTYSDTKTESIPATGHAYGDPVWNWNGTTAATATFTCANDQSHTVTETATVANKVTTAATCETTGERTYTATVTFNGQSYSDTKTESIPATGHAYGEPVWTWNGTTAATATFTCANDQSHTVTETATVANEVTTAATCETAGERSYTATVTFNGQSYSDTKTESIPATGHAYGDPVWTWSEDGKSATATFTCTECGDQQIETATITSAEKTAATCEANGTTLYTAKVTFNGTQYSSTKEVADIPALGHNYQGVVTAPTCTEQGYTTYTCTHDGSHTYTSDIVAATGHQWNDGVITTEATCETAGVKTYTCAVCGETKTETFPALGHAYGDPVWNWNGTDSATATFTCAHDNTHIVTETAVITEEITTQPTTETTGIKTITATVTFNGQTYTDTKTETIAKLVSDEGGKGDVVDLPPLTDPDSEYELEITVKATDKQYNMDGVNKGYLIELWIVNGDNKTAYNQNKTVTLSLVIPEGMEEFTLYQLKDGAFKEVDENDYTVEGGILTIHTTLSAEFVFHADKTDESSASSGGMAWYWWLLIALAVIIVVAIVVLIVVLIQRKKKNDPDPVVQVEKYDDAELKQRLNAQQKQIDELLNRDDDGFNDIVDGDDYK